MALGNSTVTVSESSMVDREKEREITRLIVKHQHQINAFIYSLIPNRQAAEDILQEVCVEICKKFEDFELGTNFVAWANSIAYWKVRRAKVDFVRSKLVFSGDLLASISDTHQGMEDELQQRHEALDRCLHKLKPRDRSLVLTRYQRGHGVAEAAQMSGRSLQAAYKALMRIRQALRLCIENDLAGGEAQ